ncbi:MAG: hypothetical protein WDO14_12350 [Bacteroidota bacterium]
MKIALECKPDERLVMGLGVPRKKVLHQNDKGDVCNFLQKSIGNIGLIDEDPNGSQPRLLSQFKILSENHRIRNLTDKKNSLVVICPRLEDWIVEVCHNADVKLSDYSLASNPKDLAKEINYKLDKFDRLIAALLVAKSPELLHLQSLLKN